MINKGNEHIVFHYLLTKLRLCTLILLELNIFLKKVLNKVKDKSIAHSIFRTQSYNGMICRFYCMAFKEHMIAGKNLLDYTNSFSLQDYKKNEKIIYKYFQEKYGKLKRRSWKNRWNKKLSFGRNKTL